MTLCVVTMICIAPLPVRLPMRREVNGENEQPPRGYAHHALYLLDAEAVAFLG